MAPNVRLAPRATTPLIGFFLPRVFGWRDRKALRDSNSAGRLVAMWVHPGSISFVCGGAALITTETPTLADVLAARQRISPYLRPTALHRYPALDKLVGTETWVKHENHQPICAFKVRGGINLISQLTKDERRQAVSYTHLTLPTKA